MSKTVKISANQSLFNNTNNLIDIDIPEGMGTVDLSKSSVLINVSMFPVIAGGLTNDDGVPSVQESQMYFVETDAAQASLIYPSTLVKNAYFKTSKKGMVHSLRRVDTRKYAINNYTQDLEEKNNAKDGFKKPIGPDARTESPFINYKKNGSVASTYKTNTYRIPLNEVYDVCNASAFDLSKRGSVRLHMEMNFNKFQGGSDAQVAPYEQLTYDDRVGGAAVDVFSIIFSNKSATSNVYTNHPYFVGQKVKIVYNDNGAGDVTVHRTIGSISFDSSTLKYSMTFANKIYTGSGAGNVVYTSVNGSVALSTTTDTINDVQLELQLTDEPDNQPIVYTDWTTEEDTFASTTSLNKQYVLEGEADNLMLCVVHDVLPKKPITSYRLRIDNQEQTDRDVSIFSSEHKDLTSRLFKNMDYAVEDITERACIVEGASPETNPSSGTRIYTIGSVLPLKNRPKNLNVNIESAGIEKVILYKRMLKTL